MQQAQNQRALTAQGSAWDGMQVESSCLASIHPPALSNNSAVRPSQYIDHDNLIVAHGTSRLSFVCTAPVTSTRPRCSKLPHRCASCKMSALNQSRCWFVPHTISVRSCIMASAFLQPCTFRPSGDADAGLFSRHRRTVFIEQQVPCRDRDFVPRTFCNPHI